MKYLALKIEIQYNGTTMQCETGYTYTQWGLRRYEVVTYFLYLHDFTYLFELSSLWNI